MQVEKLLELIGTDFYTGVPDSQLRALCDCLMDTYGIDPRHHVIAANEGNAAALAAGYHLATGKVPVVYMQNSGEGNIINPVASLLHEKVYAIPMVFVIGWRGEPGVHDEPQHIYQGEVTLKLLADMGIAYSVISPETTEAEVAEVMAGFRELLDEGKDVAFVVRKGALTYDKKVNYKNPYAMNREEVIRHITAVSGEDPVISTTGKASRELFEIREANRQGHRYDFLTVGSMGHSSSIALGVAFHKPGVKVWCIDGDGAVLMHMGAMAVMGAYAPENLVHIILNNGAHETVGGMPTVAGKTEIMSSMPTLAGETAIMSGMPAVAGESRIRGKAAAAGELDFVGVAKACGYPYAVCVDSYEALDEELAAAKRRDALSLIEVKCALGARADLGRPTTTARENKQGFMEYLKEK